MNWKTKAKLMGLLMLFAIAFTIGFGAGRVFAQENLDNAQNVFEQSATLLAYIGLFFIGAPLFAIYVTSKLLGIWAARKRESST